MTRETFQKHMKELEEKLIQMCELVEKSIYRSVESLKNLDVNEAEKIIADDKIINKKRWEIEEECISLIATQQPVATDLRELIALLNIIVDLERIADHAAGIAQITIMHHNKPLVKPLIDIPRMAEKAANMVKNSVESFIKRDPESSKAICHQDNEIDLLYEQVYRELLSFMIEDPKTITRATYLIWATHNLERIADRATNICERTVFLTGGALPESDVSKY